MYGFIREGVPVGEEEKEDECDDFGQRLLDRRGGEGSTNHSVGYRKQDKLHARADSEVTHFGNFVKGSLKVVTGSAQ